MNRNRDMAQQCLQFISRCCLILLCTFYYLARNGRSHLCGNYTAREQIWANQMLIHCLLFSCNSQHIKLKRLFLYEQYVSHIIIGLMLGDY